MAKVRANKGKKYPLAELKKLCVEKPEIGEEIYSWTQDGVSSQDDIRSVIAQRFGIALTFNSKLSEWLSWWEAQLKRELRSLEREQGNALALDVLKWFRENKPDASAEELRSAQLLSLYLRAEAKGDAELQLEVLKLQGKDKDRGLTERRVALLEQKMERAAAELEKLREPETANSEAQRTAILDEVDRIMGIKK